MVFDVVLVLGSQELRSWKGVNFIDKCVYPLLRHQPDPRLAPQASLFPEAPQC